MPSSDDSSFSRGLEGVRAGNPQATAKMARRYWGSLVALLRPRVRWYGRRPRARAASSLGEFSALSASISGIAASREEWERLIAAVKAYQPAGSEYARGAELAELVRMLRDGYDIPQIAERLTVARCTVYRWIQIIRKIGEKIGIAIQTGEPAP